MGDNDDYTKEWIAQLDQVQDLAEVDESGSQKDVPKSDGDSLKGSSVADHLEDLTVAFCARSHSDHTLYNSLPVARILKTYEHKKVMLNKFAQEIQQFGLVHKEQDQNEIPFGFLHINITLKDGLVFVEILEQLPTVEFFNQWCKSIFIQTFENRIQDFDTAYPFLSATKIQIQMDSSSDCFISDLEELIFDLPIENLSFVGPTTQDNVMSIASMAPDLKGLYISGITFTNQLLLVKLLKKYNNLKRLSFNSGGGETEIGDTLLAQICFMKNLSKIILGNSKISGLSMLIFVLAKSIYVKEMENIHLYVDGLDFSAAEQEELKKQFVFEYSNEFGAGKLVIMAGIRSQITIEANDFNSTLIPNAPIN